jgi:hypothetical protein
MTVNIHKSILILFLLFLIGTAHSQTLKALFDNTKTETAGNADWIIDTHQPIPSPAQSGITQSTPETYWLGAISAWGVDLVKMGFTVHTLTSAYGITYGNPSNPYDLSNYNVFIVCEPQDPFSAAEKLAITSYVQNGGGLFMVSDHAGSDRNNNNWDSPQVWNDLRSDSLFGIHFQSTAESNNNITQNTTNVASENDSIITGPAGTASILSYHNGATITLTSSNPSAQGHVWMTGASHGSSQIMLATARYGFGRVGAIGDSSPADDSTGQARNSSLFNGWTGDAATDNIFFLNLTMWLATTPPAPDPPPQVALVSPLSGDSLIVIPTEFRWNQSSRRTNYQFDLSTSNTFSSFIVSDSSLTDTVTSIPGLSLNTTYYWRVRAKNGSGWGQYSSARNFSTWDVPAQVQLDLPADGTIDLPLPIQFTWHPVLHTLNYGFDLSSSNTFSSFVVSDSTLTDTTIMINTLALGTKYYWRVRGKNDAGRGTYSDTRIVTTWDVPHVVLLSSPVNGARGEPDPAMFIWHLTNEATAYHFQLATDAAFTSIIRSDSTLVDTSTAVGGLDSTLTNYWRVRAKNGAGWNLFSSTWLFTESHAETVTQTVNKGWNLVSLPVLPPDARKVVLFPSAISSAYSYSDSYIATDTLLPGSGYWLKFDSATTVSMVGQLISSDTIDVKQGWNLVGTISSPVSASHITSIPDSIIVSKCIGYQQGYSDAPILIPMRGFWVKVIQPGKIVMK